MQKWRVAFLGLLLSTAFYAQEATVYDSLYADLTAVKAKCIIDKKNESVLNILNKLYNEALQGDEGLLSKSTLDEYSGLAADSLVPNWQIIYLFRNYQNLVTKANVDPDVQIGTVKLLFDEVLTTYDHIPAIVLVYMGEALIATGYQENAEDHFKTSVQFYPESIPLRVYYCLLLPEGAEKEKLKKTLLKKHGEHWMVHGMLKGG